MNRLRPLRASLSLLHKRVPCGLLCALTAVCLLLREQFPFSNFPMYSNFGNDTDYVHLADAEGQPLATLSVAGLNTATLKKLYQGELNREVARLRIPRRKLSAEQKRIAGERLLLTLKSSRFAHEQGAQFPPRLQLREVNISRSGDHFLKRSVLIAEQP